MKFCQNCGNQVNSNAYTCPNCGSLVNGNSPQPVIINNTYVQGGKKCDKWVAFCLCFFLGVLGIHKFYEGKVGMGILYIFTLGLFGIGVFVDWIVILTKPNPYYV